VFDILREDDPLATEDQAKPHFPHTSRLSSIKTKIILFAVIATVIPSVTMWWLSYVQNRKLLSEKITQELMDVSAQASREVDLWFKERLYDVRVFSSSYMLSENLERISFKNSGETETAVALRRLREYLRSVREKFISYDELALIDVQGNTVASSAAQENPVAMPERWLDTARSGKRIIGEPYREVAASNAGMVIGEPIQDGEGRLLGVLVAKLNFQNIGSILGGYVRGEEVELHVVTREGLLLAGSGPARPEALKPVLTKDIAERLFSGEREPLGYEAPEGGEVVGTLSRVPDLDWGVVAEKNREKAYGQIVRLRNVTLLLVAAVLLGIGLCAYLLGVAMVRPLGLLTKGAARVSAGDLEVDVPVRTRTEIGYLTEVFNHMVAKLRQGRQELATANEALLEKNKQLEELSITDSLTGLYNRSHLMGMLAGEVARSRRHNRAFTLLIMDIDHFKNFNDTYGHLAGDEALRRTGLLLKESIRSCDYAARYGGEEFILILPETGAEAGVEMAERIRNQIAEREMGSDGNPLKVTVSVGVASFPRDGEDSHSLMKRADAALYEAKRKGRNRVVLSGESRKKRRQETPKAGLWPQPKTD
jgi:diguanylate cyclase (GGDEF)-like protein